MTRPAESKTSTSNDATKTLKPDPTDPEIKFITGPLPKSHCDHFTFVNNSPVHTVAGIHYELVNAGQCEGPDGPNTANPLDHCSGTMPASHYEHLFVKATVTGEAGGDIVIDYTIQDPRALLTVGLWVGITVRHEWWDAWNMFGFVIREDQKGNRYLEVIPPEHFLRT